MKRNQVKKYFSTIEVAKLLNVSRITVFNRIKSGKLRATKVGRNYLIHKKDLPDIFDDQMTSEKQKQIKISIHKLVREYKETLQLLGGE